MSDRATWTTPNPPGEAIGGEVIATDGEWAWFRFTHRDGGAEHRETVRLSELTLTDCPTPTAAVTDSDALGMALTALLELKAVRPGNWDDGDDPDLIAAWTSASAAIGTIWTRLGRKGADHG